ncbi:hypothetical protein GCM10017667_20350 [Streptomyces filamentosus]|uniref:Uncharacterized protein n=1 Tax=Streptomyces filamentosus TaxID=67294 RepID=A0A919BJ48_STRFL|nr:hypothetical protein GCM10017667_20350 [Streptomyces filamentosus]
MIRTPAPGAGSGSRSYRDGRTGASAAGTAGREVPLGVCIRSSRGSRGPCRPGAGFPCRRDRAAATILTWGASPDPPDRAA